MTTYAEKEGIIHIKHEGSWRCLCGPMLTSAREVKGGIVTCNICKEIIERVRVYINENEDINKNVTASEPQPEQKKVEVPEYPPRHVKLTDSFHLSAPTKSQGSILRWNRIADSIFLEHFNGSEWIKVPVIL